MTIRNKQAYVDALWDWGFLDGCFKGTKIRVSDIDGVVERNGHVLFIEAKPPGKSVSIGQNLMFRELAANGHTVLIIWGETNKPEQAMVWRHHEPTPRKKVAATEEAIQEVVRKWFVWANLMGPKRQLDKKYKSAWPPTIELKATVTTP